jgi:hypothetical protein
VQAKAKVPVEGLKCTIDGLTGPAVQMPAANDAGDISWKVPMVKFYFPASIPHINFHHWAAGVPLATSIAHKGALAGAKVMAAGIVECLKNPGNVAEAKPRLVTDHPAAHGCQTPSGIAVHRKGICFVSFTADHPCFHHQAHRFAQLLWRNRVCALVFFDQHKNLQVMHRTPACKRAGRCFGDGVRTEGGYGDRDQEVKQMLSHGGSPGMGLPGIGRLESFGKAASLGPGCLFLFTTTQGLRSQSLRSSKRTLASGFEPRSLPRPSPCYTLPKFILSDQLPPEHDGKNTRMLSHPA